LFGKAQVVTEFVDDGFADASEQLASGAAAVEDIPAVEDDLVGVAGGVNGAFVEGQAAKDPQQAVGIIQFGVAADNIVGVVFNDNGDLVEVGAKRRIDGFDSLLDIIVEFLTGNIHNPDYTIDKKGLTRCE